MLNPTAFSFTVQKATEDRFECGFEFAVT